MATRTKLLLSALVSLCLLGATSGTGNNEQIQDFEFADIDNEAKVMKRSAEFTDDEDILGVDQELATEQDEGSGKPDIVGLTVPVVGQQHRYFRVTINITSVLFSQQLTNRNSQEFQNLANQVKHDIEQTLQGTHGHHMVEILSFSPGSVLATFDITSEGAATKELEDVLQQAIQNGRIGSYAVSPVGYSFTPFEATFDITSEGAATKELEDVLQQAIQNGRIGSYAVSPVGYSFTPFEAPDCPHTVGRLPDSLPRKGLNWAYLMINNIFPCDGEIEAWEYYRVDPQGSAFVGVWRQTENTEFTLIGRTELPAAPVGLTVIEFEQPIKVNQGDFIGIFYPRSTPNNVIAQATIADLDIRELYQTYSAEFYSDSVFQGSSVDISQFKNSFSNFTFSINAHMRYDSLQPEVIGTNVKCAPDEFTCRDGFCIDKNLVCDNQIDCNDGSDEENCPGTTISSEEPCIEGRFRCKDGTCISRILKCDGNSDCPDRSDEDGCIPCSDGEFTCADGQCISNSLLCNKENDCRDGSDELNCAFGCKEDDFTCQNGECIHISRKCDAFPDCDDRSDEDPIICLAELTTFPTVCDAGYFKCTLGGCVPLNKRCDGSRDCLDSSDEKDCVFTCSSIQFTCNSGQCIDEAKRCDSVPDCVDQSDESGCPCRSNQFECEDGQCISGNQKCDYSVDCRDGSDEQGCPCRRNEFQCNDGTCIDRRNKCDRSAQCPDSSDEFNCTCNPAEFRCSNGQCIPQNSFCDQRFDCYDSSDETNCPIVCREDQFLCSSGECIDNRRTCDGRTDCRDRSDEQNCPIPPSFQCMPGQFRCATGQCIDAGFKCDRQIDCLDRSDEMKCPTARPCPENQFQCESGHCLDLQRRCDGRRDCPSGNDELDCPACSDVEFTCSSGQCIPSALRCDKRSDCQDGSDERNCPCSSEEFTCVSDGRCLPPGYRCNGNPECIDGSDEIMCECTQSEFKCSSGQCVPSSARCDQRYDCQDGSDEFDCVPQCTSREFQCTNNVCVDLSARCNGRFECSDGSDERDCPSGITVNISPQQMRKRVGTSASFICQVTGSPPPRVAWSRRTGGAMPPQAVDSNGRLTIVNLRLEDAGDYVCQAIGLAGTFEATARLEVDYIGPPTVAPDPDGPCGRDQSTCSSGQCIPRDYVCDGEVDCTDNSDERNCNFGLPCEPNEFRCNNGKCALKIWRCDGDNDCQDNSDEFNCPTRLPGAPCRTDEFACKTNDQCIPSAYQCDGELDCQDRSDEIGCIPPSIVVPPVPEITVEVNGTFTIICEAVGVPTPLIVWRLNWGNIPSGDRVTVTSIDGRGTLVVRNAVPDDAGAYTCEAINNRGSIFAVPDALIIVRRTIGVCQSPRFNVDATRPDECIRCFCFGQTQTCYSSNLQISQITLGNQVTLVRRTNLEQTEQGFIQYIPSSREFEVREFNNVLRSGSYYWSLPYQYLRKRLSSYGGELTYRVYYEVDNFDIPTRDPDVIISGNGITLIHRSQTAFKPKTVTTVKVPLVETAWERDPDSPRSGPISEYATREDLMLVLENVTTILIRASYDNRQSLIRLGNVLLTTGVTQVTGLGRAVNVEECTCPTGYAGYSCELCAPGFYKVDQGRYGRECVACNCNGRSNDCDPVTGVCRNCRDNTAGPYCSECAVGYIGDPRTGVCQPCPCPLTTPPNQFSRTCAFDLAGEIVCTACPEGYTGQKCERCSDRYQGNPLIPGDRCIPKGADVCDERGSVSNLPDVVTQQCACKENVEGQYCNRCKPEKFHLSNENPHGCISCFCMGVSKTCQSTTWTRAQVSLPISQSSGVVLTDMMQKEIVTDGISINRQSRELVFHSFSRISDSVRYWSLPQQFLDNKVSSYGGNLRFTVRYQAGRDKTQVSLSEPLVEIGGNDITLVHRIRTVVPEGRQQSFSIPFIETQWFRMDGQPATREHLLIALADLKFILIRATHTRDTEESAISGVTMDIAESRDTGQERAYSVEQCACLRGHRGLSCEDCDTGYTRSNQGLHLRLCTPCQCNGHSSECDPETGICRNCRHNTQGDHCEICSRGYYGDATRGSVNDCQKCPCPLTESPNQFSPECVLSPDGQVTCSSCPVGHTGRRCERCARGYEGNPSQPGDYCKLINVTCDCDGRGTVANTLCDPNTQQCQCKNNVQGRRCSACLDGYFNLNRDNEMGCLKCFCMGVSDRCSSSTYYRDEIIPMLNPDGTHNFQLTNQRLTHTISDGFTINAERNEITFNNFEGIQREQETLFIALPPKFRGDKISSYGGSLRFGLSYTTSSATGRNYTDADVQIISKQGRPIYYLHRPSPKARESYSYDIPLIESSFKNFVDGQTPSREAFMTILANIDAILIRATYHTAMNSVTLRDLRMEIAVPRPTGQRPAPEVESCICPEGYTGLSCQECAPGYLRVEDSGTALGRCVRCSCNGHATSCDPETGVCRNCQHNTVGDRCERCAPGYYGDPSAGTAFDCRTCPCPLSIPSNQFSPTCILDQDNQVTCDRCPPGYTGRNCGQCAPGFQGNPYEPGGRCERTDIEQAPDATVNPASLSVPLGSTAVFYCLPTGRSPFNVVWSRIDGRPLPRRASQKPGPDYSLTITNVEFADSARYVCQVTNVYGTDRDYGTLNVERLEPAVKIRIEEPTTIVTRPGQTARFVCVAIQYSLAANYVLSWTKDGGVLPSKSIDQNGVLIIPNLNENDLGTYTCTGSDPGSVDRATATITFGAIQEPPTVRIEPRYLQVTEGASVEFKCIVEGSPRPTVRWTKGGESSPLPSHIYTDETGIFRIQSVSANDQSEYYCTATNSQGTTSVRTIIYVQRQTPIQVIVRRTNITAVIGQSEQLICYVDGNNEVILTWSRDGGLPLGATQENGVLTLTNIQPSYAGTYSCTGRTLTGSTGTATVRITVTGRAYTSPTVRIEPERQTVGTGTTGTLRCIVTGEPRPVVTWSKANGQLSANHQVNGEILRIQEASIDDRGIYVCTASNVAGSAQAPAIVEIERREPPEIKLYPENQQVRPIGSSAFFQCRVVGGIPAPVVTWTRAGGRQFTGRTEVKEDIAVIMFNSITPEEQGEYMCSATNEVGTITATASIRVEGPPVIEISPGTRITSLVGQKVNIECVGIGNPVPTVFWRSGQRRRSDVLPEAYETRPGTASLLFESITKNDEGQYICVATNERGRTEGTVDVSVLESGGSIYPNITIGGPERLSLVVGQSVELTCLSQGLQNARILWRRPGNQPLPPGHSVRNGVLHIPRMEPEYAGEYICLVVSDTVETQFSASVFIIVNVTPRLMITPSRVTSKTGQILQLRCQPSGQGPFNIEWSKLDGQLSPQARDRDGVLEIRQLTRADAGRYRCVAYNAAGVSSEGFADVVVLVAPVVEVAPKQSQAIVGSSLEIRCNVQGDPPPAVRWEKERGSLPQQHQIRNGILTIYNAQPSDSGRYICTANNDAGTAIDYALVNIDDPYVAVGTSVQAATVGESVELECVVRNTVPNTKVTWSRLDGPLPPGAIVSETVLSFADVKLEDAGTYQCTLTYPSGVSHFRVQLEVRGLPVFSVQQDYTTAALGTPAQLRCESSGSPQPQITWIKEEGDLPYNHMVLEDGDLLIPKVRKEDAGTYNCMASNQYGTSKHPVVLVIGAFVPYFKQDPVSYITYEPLTDAYQDLDIFLSFRPEATDGLLLYNGQHNTGAGDFVCFGLQGQYPEFRYDVGSGLATVRGAQPLKLNQWHTVHLKRSGRNGTMLINDEPAYFGESTGDFHGLDLAEPLYIGNVPPYVTVPVSAKFISGFVGGVSQMKLKGKDINLGADAREIFEVEQYQVCNHANCLNGATCMPQNNHLGYVCNCLPWYTGQRCEMLLQRCHQGVCGDHGRCYQLSETPGFECLCPLEYAGAGCAQRIRIVDPAFNRTSFISYPTISDGLVSVRIKLLFKPKSLDDGIVLYNAQIQDGKEDFIAVIINNRHLELRFDTSSGPAALRSRSPLVVNEWTTVLVDRKGRDGMLIVNNDEIVSEQMASSDDNLFARRDRGDVIGGISNEERTTGLDQQNLLYLGGVSPFETINPIVDLYHGFVGCVRELQIGDKAIRLIEDAIESLNIQDCGDRRICERRPCLNHGKCIDVSPTQYRCDCPAQFTGTNCETEINICNTNQPCQNGGRCVVLVNGFRCNCPHPWMGDNCNHREPLHNSVDVIGHGYVEISKDQLPHKSRDASEVIRVTIMTTEPNGLFFWQGQQLDYQGSKDYLALAVQNGYVEFRYELGSGPAVIRSDRTVDDGYPHQIIAERVGRNGSLSIDNRQPVKGESARSLRVLNVQGNIFIGGVPDLGLHTRDLFKQNFIGCLSDLRFNNDRVLSFDFDVLGGMNVSPCMLP